ncbi:MAG: hypothetical protein ABW198_05205 [Pseudorhodoplanes sp.]
MKRPILAAAAAAMFAAATIGASQEAEARGGYRGYYGDGIIGGLSANAIVGGYYPGYVGVPGYGSEPINYAAPTYPPPGCIIRRQRIWNGYAWASRKIRVCY